MKLYIGFDWVKKRYINNQYPLVFLSSAVAWTKTNCKSLALFKWGFCEEIMIDSGGFSFFEKYSDYPFPVDDYVDWIHKIDGFNEGKVNYCAIRDYPCEDSINRKAFKTNKERIERTVDNAVECVDYDSSINWMPVLQGYSAKEYIRCLNLYKERGLVKDIFAIGSMCRRTDIRSIEKVLKEIRKEYSGKIHLFGLTLNALKSKYIFDNIFSCDTIGYTFMCNTFEETEQKKEKLISRFNQLSNYQRGQTTLKNFKGMVMPNVFC